MWIPALIDSTNREEYWGAWLDALLIARMRPDATMPQAKEELRLCSSHESSRFFRGP
jgi:hypothetical protein